MTTKLYPYFYFWLALLCGLFFITLPNLGGDFSKLPGDLGDTRFNIYILEHATQFFSGKIDSYWNAGFMYPEPEVISYSDNLLGTAPIYALFRLCGLEIFGAFQAWFIALCVLNFWGAYKLTRYLTKNDAAAALAGFVFAFSLSLNAQLNHAQTFPRFAIPLAIYFLLLWAKDLKVKYFLAALSLFVYQFYCGIYLGFLATIPIGVIFLLICWNKRVELKQQILERRKMLAYLGSITANLLMLYLLFEPYLQRSKKTGLHRYNDIVDSIPTFKSYLAAPPGSFFSDSLNTMANDYPAFWDHWIFAGLLATAAFVFMIFYGFRAFFLRKENLLSKEILFVLIAAYITLLCYLRFGHFSLFAGVRFIPGFASMRCITRIVNVEVLFFAISLAICFLLILQKLKIPKTLLFSLCLTLLVFDNYVEPERLNVTGKNLMQQRHYKMLGKLKKLPAGSIVSYEPETKEDAYIVQLDAMLASQALGMKCLNGYSATSPLFYDKYWYNPGPESRAEWLSQFPDLKTRIKVVN